uniref:Uncharacterized protein n=1 Tax=Ditylenchus dipsaci TaxID=166011 RepID=A0A915CKR0_9BILA
MLVVERTKCLFRTKLAAISVTHFTWTISLDEAAESTSLDVLQVNIDGSDLVVTMIRKESKEELTFRKKVLDDGEFFQETPFKRTRAIGENKVEISGFKYTKELFACRYSPLDNP